VYVWTWNPNRGAKGYSLQKYSCALIFTSLVPSPREATNDPPGQRQLCSEPY